MKKRLLSLFTAVLCVASLACFASGCKKDEITVSDIYEANTHENLQKKYDSYSATYSYTVSSTMDGIMYFGEECSYLEYTEEEEGYLFVDNKLVYDLCEGAPAAMLYIDEEDITFVNENTPHIIILKEDILVVDSVKKQDGKIVATAKPTTQDSLEAMLTVFVGNYDEGDNVEVVFVLDENLILQKFTVNHLPVNGQETEVVTCIADYNVDTPRNCQTLYNYYTQTEDLRTVTYIANAGTSNERRWTAQAPIGVEVYPLTTDRYDSQVYIDPDCTQAYEPTGYSTDETLYLKELAPSD